MDQISIADIVLYLLAAVGALGAVRSWVHSKEARALAEELVEDVTEQLRQDIVIATAEAADQVIAKLPKRRAKTETPAAPEEPKQ